MSEYIDKGKLVQALTMWKMTLIENYGINDEYVRCLESVLMGIDSIPTVDVRHVVRGITVKCNDWLFYLGIVCLFVFVAILGFLVGWML